jgi:hypothetical protein
VSQLRPLGSIGANLSESGVSGSIRVSLGQLGLMILLKSIDVIRSIVGEWGQIGANQGQLRLIGGQWGNHGQSIPIRTCGCNQGLLGPIRAK